MSDYLLVTDDRLTRKLDALSVSLETDIAESTVSEMIDDAESDLNAILDGLGYATIPAEDSRDVAVFARRISEYVAALAWMETAGLGSTDQPPNVKFWLAEWDKFLKRLEGGKITLYGQSPTSVSAGVISIGGVTMRASQWTDTDLDDEEFYG